MDQEAKLKVGDVVTLKSGGPAMTVTALVDQRRSVTTSWLDLLGRHQWAEFPVVCLTQEG